MAADELPEDLTLKLLWDAYPFVLDADTDDAVLAHALDADDSPLGRVLDRVREQVRNHLREPVRVAVHRQRRRRQRDVEQVLGALAREEVGLLADDGAHVDEVPRDRELPLLEALHVEEVVDERSEAPGLCLDDPQILAALLVGHVPLEQDGREAEHARERGPQLVRDHADELGLGTLALPQPLVLVLELTPARLEP